MKAFICSLLLQSVLSSELFSVNKELRKAGLHRDLVTNVTFRIDSLEELEKCSFIIKENITKDTYIYYEEVKKLSNFEFWPHLPMDIEKPASVSES